MIYNKEESIIQKLAKEYVETGSVVALNELHSHFIEHYRVKFGYQSRRYGVDIENAILDVFEYFLEKPDEYANTNDLYKRFYMECRKKIDHERYEKSKYVRNIYMTEDSEECTIFDFLADEKSAFEDELANEDMVMKTDIKTISEALDRLSPCKKRAIEAHYIGGLTYPQIAESENVSIGTIKSRINSAKKQLQNELDDYFCTRNDVEHAEYDYDDVS